MKKFSVRPSEKWIIIFSEQIPPVYPFAREDLSEIFITELSAVKMKEIMLKYKIVVA